MARWCVCACTNAAPKRLYGVWQVDNVVPQGLHQELGPFCVPAIRNGRWHDEVLGARQSAPSVGDQARAKTCCYARSLLMPPASACDSCHDHGGKRARVEANACFFLARGGRRRRAGVGVRTQNRRGDSAPRVPSGCRPTHITCIGGVAAGVSRPAWCWCRSAPGIALYGLEPRRSLWRKRHKPRDCIVCVSQTCFA